MSLPLQLPDSATTTYLIDASIHIFRAWFGIPDHFFDDRQRPVNAVYGYCAFLLRFLTEVRPEKVLVAFDESLFSGFRHQLYPDYKANRALPDAALAYQLETCQQLTRWLGMTVIASPVYEADDLIASVARRRRQRGESVVVLSSDKDLAQMIGPKDYLWDYHGGKLLDKASLDEAWGFDASRVADYLALVGDSVDNIPGLPGIGASTGQRIFGHFTSLESLYANLEAVHDLGLRGSARIHATLAEHQEQAWLYRQLTQLHDTAKCPWGDRTVKLRSPDADSLLRWWQRSGLTRVLRLPQFLDTYGAG